MKPFALICSSLARRLFGSLPVHVEAFNQVEAFVKHSKCLKCEGEMKGKDAKWEKRN